MKPDLMIQTRILNSPCPFLEKWSETCVERLGSSLLVSSRVTRRRCLVSIGFANIKSVEACGAENYVSNVSNLQVWLSGILCFKLGGEGATCLQVRHLGVL